MPNGRPQKHKETFETPDRQIDADINSLRESAQQLSKNPNAKYTTEMAKLDKEKLPEQQEEGLYYLERQLMDIIIANPNIDVKNLKLRDFIAKVQNTQNREHAIAIQKVKEIMSNPANPMAHELIAVWPTIKDEAISVRDGWGRRYIRRLKEKPLETVVYTAAGAAGVYLGLKVIKWLIGKGWEKTKEKASSVFTPGNILATLGLGAFGAYQGKDAIAKFFGFNIGKEAIDKVKDSEIPDKIKTAAEKAKTIAEEKEESWGEKIRNAREKADKKYDLYKKGGIRATLEGIEVENEHKDYSNFITKQNPNLSINPMLFSTMKDIKFDDFIDKMEDFDVSALASAISISAKIFGGKKPDKKMLDDVSGKWADFGVRDLAIFFSEMLKKDPDEYPEFKGKTVAEVMEIISNPKNKDKYIDPEAVKEAYEQNEMAKEALAMVQETNPEKLKDQDWWTTLLAKITGAGMTFAVDKAETGVVWLFDNSGNVITFTHNLFYESLIKLSDRAMESDSNPIWAAGAYLHYGGARCIAVGAGLGMTVGAAKQLVRNPFGVPLAAIKGAGRGAVQGAFFPIKMAGKGVKAVAWDLPRGKFNPVEDAQNFIARQRFILEDLSIGKISRNYLGMETLSSKILKGTVQIKDANATSLMRTLSQYETIVKTRIDELKKMTTSKLAWNTSKYTYDIAQYEKMEGELSLLLEYYDKNSKTFNNEKWLEYINKINKKYLISDIDTFNILKSDKRLGIILLQENHSLTKFIKTQVKPEQAGDLISFLCKNDDVFDVIARRPVILNDSAIMAELTKLKPGEISVLKEIILKRSEVWNKFSGKQLHFLNRLGDNPTLANKFAGMAEVMNKADLTTESGRGRLVQQKLFQDILIKNTKSIKHELVFNHPEKFGILFENTSSGKNALDRFLAIDEQILSKIKKDGALSKFVQHFDDYAKNEQKIVGMVAEYEKKLGIFGSASRQLSRMKGSAATAITAKGVDIQATAGKGVEKIKETASKGAEKIKTSSANRIKALSSRFKAPEVKLAQGAQIIETGNIDDAIKNAMADLHNITKRIKHAETDVRLAKMSGRGVGKVRFNTKNAVLKAEEVLKNAKEAEASVGKHLADLKEVKKLEESLKSGISKRAASVLMSKINSARGIAGESLQTAVQSSQRIGQVSKLAHGLKFAGQGVAVVGAGLSVWTAGSSAYEAFTTDVEGRSGIAAGRAAIWGTAAIADIGATAAMLGARGASAVVGRAALPLIPLTFAGEKVFETLYEGTFTEAEWAQAHSYDEIIHQWYSSTNSTSLGDAWVTGFGIESVNESMNEKVKTLRKMYKILVVAEKNPEILQIIATEKPSDAKDKKIQDLIDKSYNKYHEYYFQHERPDLIQNYESARKYVVKAQLFDDMMQGREQALASGIKEMRIEGVNLLDPKYEITGNARNPVAKNFFKPNLILNKYKESALAFNREAAPHLEGNFENMETSYLLRLYVQMNIAGTSNPEIERDMESKAVLGRHMALIRNYLTMKREVNLNIALFNPEFYEPKMSLNEIAEHLEGFTIKDSPIYKDYENKKFDRSPAVYAMYKLAELFGYHGDVKETNLKIYFNENAASYHGVYWSGSSWYVQERGWEVDDKVGTELNKQTVDKMVALMKENPDDIIEHRHDSIFADSYDYTSQVQRMARTLENGYKTGVIKYQSAPEEQKIEIAKKEKEPVATTA